MGILDHYADGLRTTFQRTNYIIDLWEDPCGAPPLVYLETLWPHALSLFVTVTTQGTLEYEDGQVALLPTIFSQFSGNADEYIEEIFKPEGYEGIRKGKRQSKRKGKRAYRTGRIARGAQTILNPGDAVARRTAGVRQFQNLIDTPNTRALYALYQIADLGTWWWFLANEVAEETFDWTTTLYETKWCQASLTCYLQVDDCAEVGIAASNSNWINGHIQRMDGPVFFKNGVIFNYSDEEITAFGHFRIINPHKYDRTCYVVGHPQVGPGPSVKVSVPEDGTRSIALTMTIPPGYSGYFAREEYTAASSPLVYDGTIRAHCG